LSGWRRSSATRYCSATDGRFADMYYWFRRPASATI
jgi:hypothetical protein